MGIGAWLLVWYGAWKAEEEEDTAPVNPLYWPVLIGITYISSTNMDFDVRFRCSIFNFFDWKYEMIKLYIYIH